MMINLYVDPSLLAFPGRVENEDEERKNIGRFFHGIDRLYNLARKPQIALLVDKDLEKRLREGGYFYDSGNGQKERIKNFARREPQLSVSPEELSKFYPSFFDGHQVTLFDNGVEEKDIQHIPVTGVFKDAADGLSYAYFETEHKRLLRYVALLNKKIPYEDSRVILIAGKSQFNKIDVFLSGNETAPVILSSAKKADNTYTDGYIPGTLPDMYEKANIEFTREGGIKFGKALSEHKDSIIWNVDYNTPFLTSKLYYYLKTLSECVLLVRQNNYNLPMFDNALKEEIVKLTGGFGLNSVFDGSKYNRCPYREWDGRQFVLHLRPTTKNGKYSFMDVRTMRVYFSFEYGERQMLVGMICEHPMTCSKNYKCDICR
jgi:hypothetical protein